MTDQDRRDEPANETGPDAPARIDPEIALEIERLTEILDGDSGTGEELVRLVSLLREVGEDEAAEQILLHHAEFFAHRAFNSNDYGARKRREFDAAVTAFQFQFELELQRVGENNYLDIRYRTTGGTPPTDDFKMLAGFCEVRIAQVERRRIEADVIKLDPFQVGPKSNEDRESLFLTFTDGRWKVARPFEE